jgi:hypothetical protein
MKDVGVGWRVTTSRVGVAVPVGNEKALIV